MPGGILEEVHLHLCPERWSAVDICWLQIDDDTERAVAAPVFVKGPCGCHATAIPAQ